MLVIGQTARRIANGSAVALSLVLTLRCNVYNSTLLGNGELSEGGTASIGQSGTSGTTSGGHAAGQAGVAGESEAVGGMANSGLGGLAEMAGAVETGGAESNGGTAGKDGIGGAGGGMGGAVAGSAGAGGAIAGAGGANQTASGCVKLSVPLDDVNDKAHFVVSLASTVDLSSATISMRIYVQAGQGGTIFNYVQDSGTYHFLGPAKRQQLSTVSGWSTLTWNVGTEPDSAGTGIVKTSIKSIGIELNAQPSSPWSNPTIVYVDSLSAESPALSFAFDASSSISASNTSGALWLNTGASDTTATGSTLSWQATCP